jgi:hypothetical protein
VKTIEIQPVAAEPSGEDFRLFPDYLVGQLMKRGVGRIEADRNLQHDGRIDFVYTSQRTHRTEVVASIPDGFFRPMLARFGPRCGSEDMLYCGHTFFACEHEREGKKRLHRFSLFVCNDPKMGVWLKLYRYSTED